MKPNNFTVIPTHMHSSWEILTLSQNGKSILQASHGILVSFVMPLNWLVALFSKIVRFSCLHIFDGKILTASGTVGSCLTTWYAAVDLSKVLKTLLKIPGLVPNPLLCIISKLILSF